MAHNRRPGVVGFNPLGELGFDCENDCIQVREISIVEATPAREFPGALEGIECRAISRKAVAGEVFGGLRSPLAVKPGRVVLRLGGQDHDASTGSGTGGPKVLAKLPAREGVEFTRRAPKEAFAIPPADRAEISDTPPGGIMKEHRGLGFGRHPHPATRTVWWKVPFVQGPAIDRGSRA